MDLEIILINDNQLNKNNKIIFQNKKLKDGKIEIIKKPKNLEIFIQDK